MKNLLKINSIIVLLIIISLSITTCNTESTQIYYTITFQPNEGTPAPDEQKIIHGGKVIKPVDISKTGYNFDGWYKEENFLSEWRFNIDTVTDNFTLYAKWEPTEIIVAGETLLQKLQWISENAKSNTSYIINIETSETIGPQKLFYPGRNNIIIKFIGIGTENIIELYNNGSMFTIDDYYNKSSSVTLILEGNIILKGKTYNDSPLILVNGDLIINDGVKIIDNDYNYFYSRWTGYGGGAVSVSVGGSFTMNGGSIYSNISNYGGGVNIGSGSFLMNGGNIYDNSGIGVYVGGGSFTMNGGSIYSNSGIGVYVDTIFEGGGNFIKTGGVIQNNQNYEIYVKNESNSTYIRHKKNSSGEEDNLSYIRNEPNPPTISGVWDE